MPYFIFCMALIITSSVWLVWRVYNRSRAKTVVVRYPRNVPAYDDEASLIRLYELYRSYMIHESDLINHRVTWLLATNGFLLTALGFTFQKQTELALKCGIDHDLKTLGSLSMRASGFVLILSFLGCSVSYLLFTAIKSAKNTAKSLDHQYGAIGGFLQSDDDDFTYVLTNGGRRIPHIVSAGLPESRRVGWDASTILPILFMSVWDLIAIAALYQFINHQDIFEVIQAYI